MNSLSCIAHQETVDTSLYRSESEIQSEADLEHLLKYMTPEYLTPDTVEQLNEMFAEESMLQLSNFLNARFAERLKTWLLDGDIAKWQKNRFSKSVCRT